MAEEKKKGILSNLFGKKKEAEEEAARKAAEEAAQLAKSREEAAKVMEKAKAEAQAREAHFAHLCRMWAHVGHDRARFSFRNRAFAISVMQTRRRSC